MNPKLFWFLATGIACLLVFFGQHDAYAQAVQPGINVPTDIGTFNIRAGDFTTPLAVAVGAWLLGKVEPRLQIEVKWPEDSRLHVELGKDTVEALTKKAP